MDINSLRVLLHQYIDMAGEAELLELYEFVHRDSTGISERSYDEATMEMLYKRRESHRNGTSRSYTVEESMNFIREQAKLHGKNPQF